MEIVIIPFLIGSFFIIFMAIVLSIGFSKGEDYVKQRQINKIKEVLEQDINVEEKIKKIKFIIEIGEN